MASAYVHLQKTSLVMVLACEEVYCEVAQIKPL